MEHYVEQCEVAARAEALDEVEHLLMAHGGDDEYVDIAKSSLQELLDELRKRWHIRRPPRGVHRCTGCGDPLPTPLPTEIRVPFGQCGTCVAAQFSRELEAWYANDSLWWKLLGRIGAMIVEGDADADHGEEG